MMCMWYIRLIQQLAKTTCTSPEADSVFLVEHVFNLLNTHLYPKVVTTSSDGLSEVVMPGCEGDPDLVALLGVIVDLYKFRKANPQQVSLSKFSRTLFGLLILHGKSAEDDAFFSADFAVILKDRYLENVIGMGVKKNVLVSEFLDGTRGQFKAELDKGFENPEIEQEFNKRVVDAALSKIAIKLEATVFQSLHCHVSSVLSEFIAVLSALFCEINGDIDTLFDLKEHIKGVKGQSAEFDVFIHSVSRIFSQYDAIKLEVLSPANMQVIKFPAPLNQTQLLFNPKLSTHKTTSSLDLSNNEGLNSLLNPGLFSIYTKLESYQADKQCSTSLYRVCGAQKHKEAVEGIANQIKIGKLATVESVLAELKKIKVTDREDELITICTTIDKAIVAHETPLATIENNFNKNS